MASEWPQTVQVAGREYEVGPNMSIADYTEVAQALSNEAETLMDVADALGMDVPADFRGETRGE